MYRIRIIEYTPQALHSAHLGRRFVEISGSVRLSRHAEQGEHLLLKVSEFGIEDLNWAAAAK